MKSYKWKGISQSGEKMNGIISAHSLLIAKIQLRKQGLLIKKISPLRHFLKAHRVQPKQHVVFSRQLAAMYTAGIPLIHALKILADGETHSYYKVVLLTIKSDLEAGLTFSEALAKHPKFFTVFFYNLVDIGEKSGSLDIILHEIAIYKEKIESLKREIKKAVAYPLVVLFTAFLVTLLFLIYVIPQFELLYTGLGAELPAITRCVLSFSRSCQKYGSGMLVCFFIIIAAAKYAYTHSLAFSFFIDSTCLKIPLLCTIIQKTMIICFSRTLAITFTAGLPLIDALQLVSNVLKNKVYKEVIQSIREQVIQGHSLRISLENTQFFPTMIVQMVHIGEESGTLEKMLSKTALFYETELDSIFAHLKRLLEPVTMAILGLLIGILIVALYLPMFKIGAIA